MMCNSNQTLPVSVEGEGDSRWVLFKQLEKPSPYYSARMDSLFDKATNDWNEKGRAELSALLAYLLAFEVDVQLARSVHVNAARASAVEASRSSIEQFVEAVGGSSSTPSGSPTSPTTSALRRSTTTWILRAPASDRRWRGLRDVPGLLQSKRPAGSRHGRFPGELERHAPEWKRHKVSASVSATRPWAYTGIPRERRLRLPVPADRHEAGGALHAELNRAAEPANEAIKRALTAVQQTFGLQEEEDIQDDAA
jgi:hypothetical protein